MMNCREYSAGRRFVGRLPHGGDLAATLETFCARHDIQTAEFSLIGAVSRATLGTYDQKQQVYVTFTAEGSLEILSCTGNISVKDGQPFAHAHVILCEEGGRTIGGHLFPGTVIFAGEARITELIGPPLVREYDRTTGLMLWDMGTPGI
ncbi:MAG: PPC domain-containing DNA-binding protein [Thermodesulfobacteriota bacterium]